MDKNLDKALRTDPIREAEKITGQSYKDDHDTDVLGMVMHMQHSQRKKTMLSEAGDSYYNMKMELYLELAESLGFRLVHMIPFHNACGEPETEYIYYKHGCLLHLGSYKGTCDSATLYYNWKPFGGYDAFVKKEHEDDVSVTSSGHWMKDEDVWVGDHDAREALKHKLSGLEAYGEFIEPWKERPFFSLVNAEVYHQTQGMQWNAQCAVTDKITEDNVSQLPEVVRNMIPPRRKKE